MFSNLRKHLGTAGLVVAIMALVAALAGGAVAAQGGGDSLASASKKRHKKGGLTGAQKKLIKKEAKKWAQKFAKPGPPGPAGPAGLNGAPGAAGNDGAPGSPGSNGNDGNDGADGNTILSGTGAPVDGDGVDGDFYLDTAASQMYGPKGSVVADSWIGTGPVDLKGGKGDKGDTGDPWTAGGTLPPGATQTGSWSAVTTTTGAAAVPISFPIPLSAALTGANVKVNKIPGINGSATATLTEGSRTVMTSSNHALTAGSLVSGEGVPAGTFVARKVSSREYELSAAVTGLDASPKSVTLTATTRPVESECEDPSHPGAAGPDNPEASAGFLCIYPARDSPGLLEALASPSVFTFPSALTAAIGSPGASVSGAYLSITNAGDTYTIHGTFAVTG